MANIVLEKVTTTVEVETETKVIEVPDCTPQLEEAERLKELSIIAAQQATKTVEVMRDSILQQVTTYWYEIFKPCLEFMTNNDIRVCDSLDFCDGRNLKFSLYFNAEDGIPYMQISTYDRTWTCIINSYDVSYNKDMSGDALESLASHWKDIKWYCKKAINNFTDTMTKKYQGPLNRAERRIETLANFEL